MDKHSGIFFSVIGICFYFWNQIITVTTTLHKFDSTKRSYQHTFECCSRWWSVSSYLSSWGLILGIYLNITLIHTYNRFEIKTNLTCAAYSFRFKIIPSLSYSHTIFIIFEHRKSWPLEKKTRWLKWNSNPHQTNEPLGQRVCKSYMILHVCRSLLLQTCVPCIICAEH